jgi:hypothetical protein
MLKSSKSFCYSRREMRILSFRPGPAFLLLCLTVFTTGTIPQARHAQASEGSARLRFGQSLALSDFDSDGLIDRASLGGFGLRKNVEIFLSSTANPIVLRFDTRVGDYGSLLAEDVDNDGATDLIWTDLLHSDDVVVWFGDGSGKFERVPKCLYADGFTLGDANVTSPVAPIRETSIGAASNRSLDRALVYKVIDRTANRPPSNRDELVATLPPALSQPTDRGPPYLLS